MTTPRMTMAVRTHVGPGRARWIGRALWQGLRAAGAATVGAARRQHAVARTIRELSALDDLVLRDIGVVREQIPAVARALVAGDERGRRVM